MKFSKRLIVVILVIILCVPCICAISGPKSDVHAYSKMYSDQDVYYFSDSNPYIQEEEFEKNKLSVYYDVKNLLTPYEFRYLVYTGYFWGLNDKIVVIDIKTMLPDVRLLRDLFCLLKDQGCLVAFITPNLREDYEVELEGDEIDYLPVDYYESCQNLYWGAYRLFWDYTVFDMAYRNSLGGEVPDYVFDDPVLSRSYWGDNFLWDIWQDTTIMIDGRFFGINEYSNLDLETVIKSHELQRFLVKLYYGVEGVDADNVDLFDHQLYNDLWERYCYLYGCDLEFDNIDIYGMIPIWESIPEIDWYASDFYYEDVIWDCFKGLVDDLRLINNFHIYIHIRGTNEFWELIYDADYPEYDEQKVSSSTVYSVIKKCPTKAYGILAWYPDNFFDFLKNLQDNYGTQVYLWEFEPVTEWGDGLKVSFYDEVARDFGLDIP